MHPLAATLMALAFFLALLYMAAAPLPGSAAQASAEELAADTPDAPAPDAGAQEDDGGAAPAPARPAVADAAPASGTWLPEGYEISGSEVWPKSSGPYIVPSTVTIDPGARLSIEAGTVVKFGAAAALSVYGDLDIAGTAAEPVEFTSIPDDSIGGDTEGDGPGDADAARWQGIATLSNSAHVSIRYARFDHAGNNGLYPSETGVLSVNGGIMEADHVSFGAVPGQDVAASGGTFTGTHILFGPAQELIHARQNYEGPAPIVEIHESSLDEIATGAAVLWTDLGEPVVHLEDNWWGTPAGPSDHWLTTRGNFGNPARPQTFTEPWLDTDDLDDAPHTLPVHGSSVLFLPGIEGSRLYDADGKLWEPYDLAEDGVWGLLTSEADRRVKKLFLDGSGESISDDVHAKDGDILESANGNDYYASFARSMDALVSDGTIRAWKPVAYDWRLSLEDLLTRGAERDGDIYYEEATDTPYIEQTLRALAAGSKTGKVTIVAHSNGGLVAKALLARLGDEEASRLIDNVILVGVPQSGTPQAIAALLFGYREGISALRGLLPIVTPATARMLADSAPAAYQMIPSIAYFDAVHDPAHAPLSFDGPLFASDEMAYGNPVVSWVALENYLEDKLGNRRAQSAADVSAPAVLSNDLLEDADRIHGQLDSWWPSAGVTAYQIAGWGDDSTLAGVALYSVPRGPLPAVPLYRAVTTEDGDGTVAVPSALLMGDGTSTPRLWFDLGRYARDGHPRIAHAGELSLPPVQELIANIIKGAGALPDYFSTDAPQSSNPDARLRFTLHDGAALEVFDGGGHRTGMRTNGTIEESIPGSSYRSLGAIEYVTVPFDGSYTVRFTGKPGSASFDTERFAEGSSTIETAAGIPETASTTASMTVSDGVATPLSIDEDGDGTADFTAEPGATAGIGDAGGDEGDGAQESSGDAPPNDTAASTSGAERAPAHVSGSAVPIPRLDAAASAPAGERAETEEGAAAQDAEPTSSATATTNSVAASTTTVARGNTDAAASPISPAEAPPEEPRAPDQSASVFEAAQTLAGAWKDLWGFLDSLLRLLARLLRS